MNWTFERVAGPLGRPLGGLAWDGAGMLFADILENEILRFDPRTGKVASWRRHTNRTNGIAFGDGGAVYGCQEGSRRIVRYETDGSATLTTQQMPDGRVHNHPCSLAVDAAGRVWFTDPHNELAAAGPQLFGRLDHASVLRLEQDPAPQRRTWTIRRMTFDTVNPRGVALAPDGSAVYVSDSDPDPAGRRELRRYPVRADGTLGPPHVMHVFGADVRGVHRGAEGLCVDAAGDVLAVAGCFQSGPGPAVHVFAPSGLLLASHALPEDLPNACAFGERESLYVTTAGGCLLRAQRTGRRAGR